MANSGTTIALPVTPQVGSPVAVGQGVRQTAVATRTRLRVRHKQIMSPPQGRTFRDPHEQVIEHQVVPHKPYHSYVAAGALHIDVDAQGHPILVELDYSGIGIVVNPILQPPVDFAVGSLRFLDPPSRCRPLRMQADFGKSLFYIEFTSNPVAASVQCAPGAIWEVDRQSCLSGLWLLRGLDDPYGRGRARWRARCWRRARLQALLAGGDGPPERLSPISEGESP